MDAGFKGIKKRIKTILRIISCREFKLFLYLSSIDDDYFAASHQEYGYHPLFDADYYRARYLEHSFSGNPFIHFLTRGYQRRYRPGPFFDYDVYEESFDWQPGLGNPLKHYLSSADRWRRPGIFFDTDHYRDKTPALQATITDPVKHYRLHGSAEGKSPIPIFDPEFYQEFMVDAPLFTDSLSHYLTSANSDQTPPSALFDPSYYRDRYSWEMGEFSPVEHYLRKGVYGGNYISERIENLKCKPLISIIVPVYNPDPCFLNNCIRSVLYQQYPHWQLCLADDGSTREEIGQQLMDWQARDERIKVVFLPQNQGISGASNKAGELADGDYFGFLDNDDELAPDCLYYLAQAISDLSAEVIYTDEDLVGDDGRRFSIFHKPDFNRALLYSHNYITHFVAVSRTLYRDCGGLSPEYDGAQDLDFMLRVTDQAVKIVHIPRVLYHWRATKTSTSINHDQKGYAHEAGKRALQAHLDQNIPGAIALDGDINYSYRVKKDLDTEPSVTVLVWSSAGTEPIRHVETLKEKTAYGNFQFALIADTEKSGNGETDHAGTLHGEGICTVYWKNGTARAQALSEVVSLTESDYVLFLDSTVFDVDSSWLKELVSQMTVSNVGMVCGRVSCADGDGPSYTVPDLSSESPVYYHQFLTSCSRHLNGLHCQQYLSFAPWDICIVRRSDYQRLGGFDYAHYPALFTMTDLALRAAQEGLHILYTPYARVYGEQVEVEQTNGELQNGLTEKKTFQNRWRHILRKKDPYYNLGILDEHNIDREAFMHWFTGGAF